jgi:hypothetical protein
VQLLNDFTIVLFTMNWVVVGLTMWWLSRAAWVAGLISPWLERLTLVGAAALGIGATQSVSALRGTLLPLAIGLLGFAVWLLFLIVVGVRVLRADDRRSSDHEAAREVRQG